MWYCIYFRNYSYKSLCFGKIFLFGCGDRRGSLGFGCMGRFDFWGLLCKFYGCKVCMCIYFGCSLVWWEGVVVMCYFWK